MAEPEVGGSSADRSDGRRALQIRVAIGLVVVGLVGLWLGVTGGEALQQGAVSVLPRAEVELALVDDPDERTELALLAYDPDDPPRVQLIQSVTNHLPVSATLLAVELPLGMACGPLVDGSGRAARLDAAGGVDEGTVASTVDLPIQLAPAESALLVLDLTLGCPDGGRTPSYEAGSYASTEGLVVRLRALGRTRTVRVETDHRLGWTTAALDTISFGPDATVTVHPPQLP